MNCCKPINNSCACSCGCGNSSLCSPADGNSGRGYVDTDKCDLMCPIRSQELLSVLEEKTDQEINRPRIRKEIRKEFTIEVGAQAVLTIDEVWEGVSVMPFYWECSDYSTVLLQPVQCLSQAQIMGMKRGKAIVKATCVCCGCELVVIWNITVTPLLESTPTPNPPCNCKPEPPKDCCWGDSFSAEGCCKPDECMCGEPLPMIRKIERGGNVCLEYPICISSRPLILHKETWLDLRGHRIITNTELPENKFIVTESSGTIFNGKIIDESNSGNFGIVVARGELTISSLKVKTEAGLCINVLKGATLNIGDGVEVICLGDLGCIQSQGGKINIFGGKFECVKSRGEKNYCLGVLDCKKKAEFEYNPIDYIEVHGGKFINFDPSEYVPSGYIVEVEDCGFDTVYTVLPETPIVDDPWECPCKN